MDLQSLAPFFSSLEKIKSPGNLQFFLSLSEDQRLALNRLSPPQILTELVRTVTRNAATQRHAFTPNELNIGARQFLEMLLTKHEIDVPFFVSEQNQSGWSQSSLYSFWKQLEDAGCVVSSEGSRKGKHAQKQLTARALICSAMRPLYPLKKHLLAPSFWNNVKNWSDFYSRAYLEFESASRFADICYSAALALATLGVSFREGELTPETHQSVTAAMNTVARFFGVYQNNDAEWVESENPYGYFAADNAGAVLFDRLEAASKALWLEQLKTPVEQQRKLVKSTHGPSLETEAPRPENPSPVLPDTEGEEPALPDFNSL